MPLVSSIWPSKSRTASSNILQLCEDTGCSPEDLPEAMNDMEKWRERIRISVLAARHDDDELVLFQTIQFSKCT